MTIPLPHISDQTTGDAWSYRATLQINEDTARIDNLELTRPVISRTLSTNSSRTTAGGGTVGFNVTEISTTDSEVGGINNNFTLGPELSTGPGIVAGSRNIVAPANGAGLYHLSYNIRVIDIPVATELEVTVLADNMNITHTLSAQEVGLSGNIRVVNLNWSGIVRLNNNDIISVNIRDTGVGNNTFIIAEESDISLYRI